MCLIVFAYKAHPDYKLILAANRDEFYERPTSVASWWKDKPEILAGRDLKAMGTWMGINKNGRFSALTNYRDLANIRENVKSRGDLPTSFLLEHSAPSSFADSLITKSDQYNGYNLLVLDKEMVHLSNYENKVNILQPGIYGLSNALLDTPWPKVKKAKADFSILIKEQVNADTLFSLMYNSETAPDGDLPDTGLSYEMEKALSAMCIRTPNYGTCCSTVVTIDHDDNVTYSEKSYPVGDRKEEIVSFSFQAS